MSLDLATRVQAMYEASYVERMHTVPHHLRYTVGQHSYNMAMLLILLWPKERGDPPYRLLRAVLEHDVWERWVGDTPFMAKVLSGQLADQLLNLERFLEAKFNGRITALSREEQDWLVALDRLEFFLWCWHELMMGNNHVRDLLQQCRLVLLEPDITPKPVLDFVETYRWQRTNDLMTDYASEEFYGE